MKNEALSPFPSGWFVVSFSHELKRGKVLSKTFMGEEIVLFRTQEGVAAALDAHCPHLGAHLGYGGTVEGDCIRCPFHHFEFYPDGSCHKSKNLKAKNWPLIERDGFILLYYGNPDKKHILPDLTKEKWKFRGRYAVDVHSHPQQTMENIVDLIHFNTVHKMMSIKLVEMSEKNGVLSGTQEFEINLSLFGKSWKLPTTKTQFEIFGLGYVLTRTPFPAFDIEVSALSAVTPLKEGSLRLTHQIFTRAIEPASLFSKFIAPLLSFILFKKTIRVLQEDLSIWEHQQYVVHPPLLPGESSIAIFRKWAKRFYE